MWPVWQNLTEVREMTEKTITIDCREWATRGHRPGTFSGAVAGLLDTMEPGDVYRIEGVIESDGSVKAPEKVTPCFRAEVTKVKLCSGFGVTYYTRTVRGLVAVFRK